MLLDHMATRAFADHGSSISKSLHGVLHNILDAFRVLERIEYDAPWKATLDRKARS